MKFQPYVNADGQFPDAEIVAAIAGVQSYLDQERPAAPEAQPLESGWHRAAKLSVQNLHPLRLAVAPRWNTIERLRRGSGGLYGIVGL